jgi:hypothetical protein
MNVAFATKVKFQLLHVPKCCLYVVDAYTRENTVNTSILGRQKTNGQGQRKKGKGP